ncbi:MAG: gamma-glutamyltransferase family protein, partial [Alphaproteobacteria bacterium]|nr:gamma-glutamyltransferase family protein [Alphaproteobacteria bacterium]
PLSNMCPTIVSRDGAPWFAIGGSGGRRIMPAVFQILSMLTLRGMELEEACHHPRIDVSGEERCSVDPDLDGSVTETIAKHMPVVFSENAVFPHHYACPNVVMRDPDSGAFSAMAHVMTPPSAALAV